MARIAILPNKPMISLIIHNRHTDETVSQYLASPQNIGAKAHYSE